MEKLKMNWKYNSRMEGPDEEHFEYIRLKENDGVLSIAGYSFIDTPAAYLYGAHSGYEITLSDF